MYLRNFIAHLDKTLTRLLTLILAVSMLVPVELISLLDLKSEDSNSLSYAANGVINLGGGGQISNIYNLNGQGAGLNSFGLNYSIGIVDLQTSVTDPSSEDAVRRELSYGYKGLSASLFLIDDVYSSYYAGKNFQVCWYNGDELVSNTTPNVVTANIHNDSAVSSDKAPRSSPYGGQNNDGRIFYKIIYDTISQNPAAFNAGGWSNLLGVADGKRNEVVENWSYLFGETSYAGNVATITTNKKLQQVFNPDNVDGTKVSQLLQDTNGNKDLIIQTKAHYLDFLYQYYALATTDGLKGQIKNCIQRVVSESCFDKGQAFAIVIYPVAILQSTFTTNPNLTFYIVRTYDFIGKYLQLHGLTKLDSIEFRDSVKTSKASAVGSAMNIIKYAYDLDRQIYDSKGTIDRWSDKSKDGVDAHKLFVWAAGGFTLRRIGTVNKTFSWGTDNVKTRIHEYLWLDKNVEADSGGNSSRMYGVNAMFYMNAPITEGTVGWLEVEPDNKELEYGEGVMTDCATLKLYTGIKTAKDKQNWQGIFRVAQDTDKFVIKAPVKRESVEGATFPAPKWSNEDSNECWPRGDEIIKSKQELETILNSNGLLLPEVQDIGMLEAPLPEMEEGDSLKIKVVYFANVSITNQRTGESWTYKAKSDVTDEGSWKISGPLPERLRYISEPSQYAELKNYGIGSNQSGYLYEDFEVMAGVPSTRQLYYAVGGSEFIIDISFEYEEHKQAIRSYTSYIHGIECEFYIPDAINNAETIDMPNDGFITTPANYVLKSFNTGDDDTSGTGEWIDNDIKCNHEDGFDGKIVYKIEGDAACGAEQGAETWHSCPYCGSRVEDNHTYVHTEPYSAAVGVMNELASTLRNTIVHWKSSTDEEDREKKWSTSISTSSDFGDHTSRGNNGAGGCGGHHDCKHSCGAGCSKGCHHSCNTTSCTSGSACSGSHHWEIILTATIPDHCVCGPCCSHLLPDIYDTWSQSFEYDSMKITDVHLERIDQGAAIGLEPVIGPAVDNSKDGDVHYEIGVDHGTYGPYTNPAELASGTVGACIKSGTPTFFYTIAMKNSNTLLGNDSDHDGDHKVTYFTQDGIGKATETSLVGRVRYNIEPQQHDEVFMDLGQRTDKCDGLCKTYPTNVLQAGGKGHWREDFNQGEEWAHGFSFGNHHGGPTTKGCNNSPDVNPVDLRSNRGKGAENYDANDFWQGEEGHLWNHIGQTRFPLDTRYYLGDAGVSSWDHHEDQIDPKYGIIGNTDEVDKTCEEYDWLKERRYMDCYATMITDTLILQTSIGDQSLLYFEKESDKVWTHMKLDLEGNEIETDGDDLPVTAESQIERMEIKKEEMWDDNPLSCSDWLPDHINIGGYNGKYYSPNEKFKGNGGNIKVDTFFDNDPGQVVQRIPRPPTRLMIYSLPLNIIPTLENKSYLEFGLQSEVFWTNVLHWTDRSAVSLGKPEINPLQPDEVAYEYDRHLFYTVGHSGANRPAAGGSVDVVINDPYGILSNIGNVNIGTSGAGTGEFDFSRLETIKNIYGQKKEGKNEVTVYDIVNQTDKDKSADGPQEVLTGPPEPVMADKAVWTVDFPVQVWIDVGTFKLGCDGSRTLTFDVPKASGHMRGIRVTGNGVNAEAIGHGSALSVNGTFSKGVSYGLQMLGCAAGPVGTPVDVELRDSLNSIAADIVTPPKTIIIDDHAYQGWIEHTRYSDTHSIELNPLIIHSPVSSQTAALISLPSSRDQRYNSKVDASALDKLAMESMVCPRNAEECEFAVLNCKYAKDQHLAQYLFNSNKALNSVTESGFSVVPGYELKNNRLEGNGKLDTSAYDKLEEGQSLGIMIPMDDKNKPSSGIDLNYKNSHRIKVSTTFCPFALPKHYYTDNNDKNVESRVSQILFSFANIGLYVSFDGHLGFVYRDTEGKEQYRETLDSVVSVNTPVTISAVFSFNNLDACTINVNGKDYSMTRKNLSLSNLISSNDNRTRFLEEDIGEYLNIGPVAKKTKNPDGQTVNYGNLHLYGLNGYLDNINVYRLAGYMYHTDDCYDIIEMHPSGKNAHIHTTDCLSGGHASTPVSIDQNVPGQYSVSLNAGEYQVEVWGAQGGNEGSYSGGKGGYSKGVLHLDQAATVYYYVGGAGSANAGGANGGGSGRLGGGGASHIALMNGTLKQIGEANKSKVLLVSGGGGGAGDDDGSGLGGAGGGANQAGGNGGAGFGQYGFGGEKTIGGNGGTRTYNGITYYGSNGLFGVGGDAYIFTGQANNGGGGGGGGFYGGGGAVPDGPNYNDYDDAGGGGGSGYASSKVKDLVVNSGVQAGNGRIKIFSEGGNGYNFYKSKFDAKKMTIPELKSLFGDAYDDLFLLPDRYISAEMTQNYINSHVVSTYNLDLKAYSNTIVQSIIGTSPYFVLKESVNTTKSASLTLLLDNKTKATKIKVYWSATNGNWKEANSAEMNMAPEQDNQVVDFYFGNNPTWKGTMNYFKIMAPSNSDRNYDETIVYKVIAFEHVRPGVTEFTTSGQHKYVPEVTGYYLLESWGAQGGGNSSSGYGGYTKAIVRLNEGEPVYAYVGGQGTKASSFGTGGGYNGGGQAGKGGYGGGGMTTWTIAPTGAATTSVTKTGSASIEQPMMIFNGYVSLNSSSARYSDSGATWTNVRTFVAPKSGYITFVSTSYTQDPAGRILVNGSEVAKNDDNSSLSTLNGGSGANNFGISYNVTAGTTITLQATTYNTNSGGQNCNIKAYYGDSSTSSLGKITTGYTSSGDWNSTGVLTVAGGGGGASTASTFKITPSPNSSGESLQSDPAPTTHGAYAEGTYSSSTPYCWYMPTSGCSYYKRYAYTASESVPTASGHSGCGWTRAYEYDYFGAIGSDGTGEIKNFSYTGNVQSTTLAPGTYKLEVWGAQGGGSQDGNSSSGVGGNGGYSVGTITLNSPTTVYVAVGGKGGNSSSGVAAGGYNGGGSGYASSSSEPGNGGGGGTDIRIGSNSMYARVIVAGGGGGGGEDSSDAYGHGGGTSGVAGTGSPSNGTQTSAGTNGSFGQGATTVSGDGGGGGGGWYGGGTTQSTSVGTDTQGGGGGSGYVYTSSTASSYPAGGLLNSSYYLTSAETKAGNTSFPSPTGSNETGHSGNGYARITNVAGVSNNSGSLSAGESRNINFVTGAQEITLAAGTYVIEAWGASGAGADPGKGGDGGYINGTFTFNTDTTIYYLIGEKGVYRSGTLSTGPRSQGFGGGGYGYGGSGGGGTFVYLNNDINTASNLLLVAGGGGGAADQCGSGYTHAIGHGGYYAAYGNLNGTNARARSGGTQSSGGTLISGQSYYGGNNGSYLYGGNGAGGDGANNSGGGGGGGYYGGAGGGQDTDGGGGGSSYINTSYGTLNQSATATVMTCPNSDASGTDGKLKITCKSLIKKDITIKIPAQNGANGGGNSGSNITSSNGAALGGTQTSGFMQGCGQSGEYENGAGGGGGGYYGGQSGPCAGAGGSGFVNYSDSRVSSSFTDAHGKTYTSSTGTSNQTGNGKARVTFIEEDYYARGFPTMDEIINDLSRMPNASRLFACDRRPNTHIHDKKCYEFKSLNCTELHHSNQHYEHDELCYDACMSDAKHRVLTPDKTTDGSFDPGHFINLDWEYNIYYANVGDFSQSPRLLGIGNLTSVRGKGYYNSMDTTEWTRAKFVIMPVNVIYEGGSITNGIDALGFHYNDRLGDSAIGYQKLWLAGEWINIGDKGHYDGIDGSPFAECKWSQYASNNYYDIWGNNLNGSRNYRYRFYCVEANNEQISSAIEVCAIAINNPVPRYSNSYVLDAGMSNNWPYFITNRPRFSNYTSVHSSYNMWGIDVVGRIGSLAVMDTGDYRFSNLFKLPNGEIKALPDPVEFHVKDGLIKPYPEEETTAYLDNGSIISYQEGCGAYMPITLTKGTQSIVIYGSGLLSSEISLVADKAWETVDLNGKEMTLEKVPIKDIIDGVEVDSGRANYGTTGPGVTLAPGNYRVTVSGSELTHLKWRVQDGLALQTDLTNSIYDVVSNGSSYSFRIDNTLPIHELHIVGVGKNVKADVTVDSILVERLNEDASEELLNGTTGSVSSADNARYGIDVTVSDSTAAVLKILSTGSQISVSKITHQDLGSDGSNLQYLVEGIVKEVDITKQNYYLTHAVDLRGINLNTTFKYTWNHLYNGKIDRYQIDTYSTLEWAQYNSSTGLSPTKIAPLTGYQNTGIIDVLTDQQMLVGYDLFYSINTLGNYYKNGSSFLQVIPEYYALNLKTREITPVDAYILYNSSYYPVNIWGLTTGEDRYTWGGTGSGFDLETVYNYNISLKWAEENLRRNETEAERYMDKYLEDTLPVPKGDLALFVPKTEPYIMGNAQFLQVNGKARTFIGGETTLGKLYNRTKESVLPYNSAYNKVSLTWQENLDWLDYRNNTEAKQPAYNGGFYKDKNTGILYNPTGRIEASEWWRRAQRWHLTLGLPTSTEFVRAGQQPNIKTLLDVKGDDWVIVGTVDIRALGEVWNLRYTTGAQTVRVKDTNYTIPSYIYVNGHRHKFPVALALYQTVATVPDDITIVSTH